MADISANFAIRQFLVKPTVVVGQQQTGGTPIVAPIGCSQIVLENTDPSNSLQVFTDPADLTTIKNIPAGLELTLRASVTAWAPAQVVCFVSSANPQGICTVTFLR